MRQLSEILLEKIEIVGGKAALGRLLGGLTGQAIGQYTVSGMPSLSFAIHWKRAFNENLIDLMFADEQKMPEYNIERAAKYSEEELPMISERIEQYNTDKRLIEAQRQLIECQAARLAMERELSDLKNFMDSIESKPKLKK